MMSAIASFPWIDFFGLFVAVAGYIVGLGAVTVIEMHAWRARRSPYWTEATTRTHKITKPLIWIGLAQAFAGSAVFYRDVGFTPITTAQLVIGLALVANGLFLTFVVSPFLLRREHDGHATETLPARWQHVIYWSFIFSWAAWWTEIILFSAYLVVH